MARSEATKQAQARYRAKQERLYIMVTPEQKAILRERASADGVPLAAYIKRKLDL